MPGFIAVLLPHIKGLTVDLMDRFIVRYEKRIDTLEEQLEAAFGRFASKNTAVVVETTKIASWASEVWTA